VKFALAVAMTCMALPLAAQSPDSLREDFRRQIAASVAAPTPARRDAALEDARRIAAGYAREWRDSTLLRNVDRFQRWSPSARALKVAADSLRRAGFELYPRRGAAAAMIPWHEGRRLAASIHDSSGLAATLGNLGAGFLTLGQLDSASRYLARSRNLAERQRDWHTLGNTLALIGSVARGSDDPEAARAAYARALGIRPRSGDDRGAAADENNLGLLAEERGDTAGARRWYRAALARNRSAGRSGQAALNLGNLAALAVVGGDLDRAGALYREALILHRRAGEAAGAGFDLRNIGNLALRQGDYAVAVTALTEAAEVLSETGPPEAAAGALADLAQARAAMGDLGGAHDAVARGERLARDAGPGPLAWLALTTADLAVDAGALADAATAYARAESLAVLDGDLHTATEARQGLGVMQLRRGDALGAVRTLSAAVDALREAGDRRAAAITGLDLGAAQAAQGDTTAARRTLERARSELRAEGDPVGEATALAALGDLAEQRAEPARAELLYRAGLRRLGARGAPDVISSLRWGLGRVLRTRGDPAGAERELRAAADASAGMARRAPEIHAELALVQHARGNDAAAFETSERLRAMQQPGAASLRTADAVARLERDEALLEYLVTDSMTVVFVLTRDVTRALPLEVGRRELAAAIDFARAAILHDGVAPKPQPAWAPPLRRLHRLLLAPVESAGLLRGVRRLHLAPHAELHYLPFAALMPASGGFLVERYEINYIPSAAVWVQLGTRERIPPSAGLLAVVPFPAELPGSRDEALAISRIHGPAAHQLIGSAATESAFRKVASEYDVIHLATYGVLNRRNPLYSYVAFAPDSAGAGHMEVHEVLAQPLRARLLILSACETALASGAAADVPAGEEWIGLVRAFLDAGASNVLATLWPIGDRETARLMPRFHQGLQPQRPSAALAALQREALRNPATAAPRHWASFVVAGAGR
jgi:CHAT domain-containing protein